MPQGYRNFTGRIYGTGKCTLTYELWTSTAKYTASSPLTIDSSTGEIQINSES
jgi:hypothetical protein